MKYLLTLFISIFFFALTFASAPDEFTWADVAFIICLLAGALVIQILIARLFTRHLIIFNLILAGFATTNILYLNLVLNEAFNMLPRYSQLLSLLLALFIVNAFMNMLDEKSRVAKFIPLLFAIATVGVLAETILFAPLDPVVVIEKGKTSSENIRVVNFRNKPNIYMIGFDSLIPKILLQKHLELESTPYHDVLDDNFRRFKNFFADHIPTKPSLNSLLSLSVENFEEARRNGTADNFFTGLRPSPFLEVFKANGYETNTLYFSQYFGSNSGPYVDNYFIKKFDLWHLRWGVCEFVDSWGLRALTFMGYCHIVQSDWFRPALSKYRLHIADKPVRPIDFLIDSMRLGVQRKTPQIFVTYLYSPGHTWASFDKNDTKMLNKYKHDYYLKSETTATLIRSVIDFIDKKDPEAIVYIFGDHGPYVSQSDSFEENPTFFVQDRYGIYGGIYPRDRCAKSFDAPSKQKFMTIRQGAHMIIKCLSGGQGVFLTPEIYTLPKPIPKENNHYEDYLYE